jgi:hypothetical protein
MANKKLLLGMSVLVLAFCVTAIGCDGETDETDPKLVGTWVYTDGEGKTQTYTFNGNGDYTIVNRDGETLKGTWSTGSGIAYLKPAGDKLSVPFPYRFEGGDLYIYGEGPYKKQ